MHHHTLIRTLIHDLRSLRSDYTSLLDAQADFEYQAGQVASKLRAAQREIQNAQEEEYQQEMRTAQRERDHREALKRLKTARLCHDPYGEASALNQLKRS